MTDREAVQTFLRRSQWLDSVDDIQFLAAGEYNENFTVSSRGKRYVLRINHGSQLQLDDQITYEFNVLKVVEPSGVTPRVFYCEQHPPELDGGVLLMEYVTGRPLDYRQDIGKAACVFARIHAVDVGGKNPLIYQRDPVKNIAQESFTLINRFPDHPLAEVRKILLSYHETVVRMGECTESLFDDEEFCVVNTEVNSRNFIVQDGRSWLVDWEKAVVSFRYQDLGHFVVPTTTLWKSDYVYSEEEKRLFLKEYARCSQEVVSAYSERAAGIDELREKTGILERTILLRALSWCYMAYYEYTQSERAIQNVDTFRRIQKYMNEVEWFLR